MPEDTPQSAPDTDAPQGGQVNVQLASDGMHITLAPSLMIVNIAPEAMDAIAEQWLDKRPDLFIRMVQKRVELVKQQAIIVPDTDTVQHITRKREQKPLVLKPRTKGAIN